jgi:hypothetical protein
MIDRETFPHWRAAAGQWAHFIKPSLLVADATDVPPKPIQVPALSWLTATSDRALVVDLPAMETLAYAVALAVKGWAVVAMFNTTGGAAEVRPTAELVRGLRIVALDLPIVTSGPPAFLIDSQRQVLSKRVLASGDFDNRWYVFESDFPSEALLMDSGIRKLSVLTRGKTIGSDLRDALSSFRVVERELVDPDTGVQAPFPSARPRPVRLVAGWARGIVRNPDGTFGRRHPVTHG